MDEVRLKAALAGMISPKLADELVGDFVKLRQDCATGTLERASPGKFVEVFVQVLQYLGKGKYDERPNVDDYLGRKADHEAGVPEGLRICGARLARAIYALRSKRNIVHKNAIDPNRFDLALAHQGASWIMAELLRSAEAISMEEAGALIELVQAPVGTLVEEIDGTRIVHVNTSVRGEILILLHSHFPDRASQTQILDALFARSAGSVRNRLGEMRTAKLIHGDSSVGYRLTQSGYQAALDEINPAIS